MSIHSPKQRLTRSGASVPRLANSLQVNAAARKSSDARPQPLHFDLSMIPACAPIQAPAAQAGLAAGSADSRLEAEADSLADKLMGKTASRTRLDDRPGRNTGRASDLAPTQGLPASELSSDVRLPPAVSEVVKSPGRLLDFDTRALMEADFGRDFSRVRVHSDAKASESARSIGASAYTVGSHVVFGAGRYQPSTSAGQHLIAHELTHVQQQTGAAGPAGPASPAGRASPVPHGAPSQSLPVSAAPTGIQRQANGDDPAKELASSSLPPTLAQFRQAFLNLRLPQEHVIGSMGGLPESGRNGFGPQLGEFKIGMGKMPKIPESPGALAEAMGVKPTHVGEQGMDILGGLDLEAGAISSGIRIYTQLSPLIERFGRFFRK